MLLLQMLQGYLTATTVCKDCVDAAERAVKNVVVLVVSGAVDTPLELLPGQKVDAAQLGCGILQGVCLADNQQPGMSVACFCALFPFCLLVSLLLRLYSLQNSNETLEAHVFAFLSQYPLWYGCIATYILCCRCARICGQMSYAFAQAYACG